MITELGREELIAMGARHRAGYLAEQAGYTLGVAAIEGAPLAAMLPQGYLGEARTVAASLEAAQQDRALTAAEAKEATNGHHGARGALKVWRRKAARRAARAKRFGKPIPDALLHVPPAKNAPALVAHAVDTLKLLEANKESLVGSGVEELIAEGKALVASVQAVDAQKEVKRYAELPNAVQEFYHQKGLLYVALKMINDAGQELHAGDPVASSRYNMNILYRRGGARTEQPNPRPVPAGA